MKILQTPTSISIFKDGKLFVAEKSSHPYFEKIEAAVAEGNLERVEYFFDVSGQDRVQDAFRKLQNEKE